MDRRLYKRTVVDLMSNFIVKPNEPGFFEFEGKIYDISECGIKVLVEGENAKTILDKIKLDDKIAFQSIDEYVLFNEKRTDIFQGDAKVIRISEDDNKVVIGCKIDRMTEEVEEYIKNKKMSLFFELGCNTLI